MTAHYDIAIIGAGIAGASVAHFLRSPVSAVLIEREQFAGYHTTGRSAAFYSETYGGPDVQPLTSASRRFFTHPPALFGEHPLLVQRGALHVAREGGLGALDALERDFADSGVAIERRGAEETIGMAPMLKAAWARTSLFEPGCADIDVGALHQGFLSGAKARGHKLMPGCEIEGIARSGGRWHLRFRSGDTLSANIIVNAAGAWADGVAQLVGAAPLGIRPFRRTIVQAQGNPPAPATLPVIIDAGGDWYFKPEAGRYWISPHDEIPDVPCDAQPDEIDIATAIDRFERATTVQIQRIERSWAGLRTFAPDRLPVYGFDAEVPGFFWCAGQGGFGIQTAPAAGMLCAALLTGTTPAPDLAQVRAERYSPARFAMVGA